MKAFANDVFIDQELKFKAQRQPTIILVSTINDVNQGLADIALRTSPEHYDKSKVFAKGSIVTKLKLKGIDRREPRGVELAGVSLTQHRKTYQVQT